MARRAPTKKRAPVRASTTKQRATVRVPTSRVAARADEKQLPKRGAMMPSQQDATGAGAPRLGDRGPQVGLAISMRPPQIIHESHPLIGNITVDRAQSIIVQALLGQPRYLQDAYDDMRDRCPRLDAVCGTRIVAVQGRSWAVKPAPGYEEDREAIDVARRVSGIVARIPHWKRAVGHFADGILRGYSVSQLVWGLNADGYSAPMSVEWIHPNRISFDANIEFCFQEWNGSWPGTTLESYGPDRFVVHSPSSGRAAYPTRRGVLLSCLLPAVVERQGLRWWLKGCEKWGQKQSYVRVPEGQQDLIPQALAMLNALGDDWKAVVEGDIEINTIDGSGDFTGEAHERLLKLLYTTYSIRLLGHNLMAEVEGGSFAATLGGDWVRQDIASADRDELDDSVTHQVVAPIQKYNFPGSPPLVYVTRPVQQQRLTPQDFATGAFTYDEYREPCGYDSLPNGEGSARPQISVPGLLSTSGGASGSSSTTPPTLGSSAATPPGGAAAASPFGKPRSMRTTSPTSTPTPHPLKLALSGRLGGRAN